MSSHPILRAATARRTTLASVLTLAVVLTACAHVVQGQTCPATTGQEILERMNEVRGGAGLEPLVVDVRLVQAAREHSESMVENDFFGHRGPDGVEPADRVTETGYSWTFVAENLAAGDLTPTQVVAGWLESPLHRDNMLERAAAHVGIAYVEGSVSGQYQTYWTAVFADSEDPPQTPEGGCHP